MREEHSQTPHSFTDSSSHIYIFISVKFTDSSVKFTDSSVNSQTPHDVVCSIHTAFMRVVKPVPEEMRPDMVMRIQNGIQPLTEEVILRIFGSPDLTLFLPVLELLSAGDSIYSRENLLENLGTHVKTCLICTGTSVKLD
jgi:hypothetical protein